MAALARLVVTSLVILTVIYLCLSLYFRSVRKGKLEQWYEQEGRPGDRNEYIRTRLEDYEGALRRKLIWGVYIVPSIAVGAIIYFTNFH